MDLLLKHIVPTCLLLGGAAILLVLEFLLRKGVFRLKAGTSAVLARVCVLLLFLLGGAAFVFLTAIGAGVELMLPFMLLILLGTLI
jgi:hypothetical protein